MARKKDLLEPPLGAPVARRGFLRLCAGMAALVSANPNVLAAPADAKKREEQAHPRVLLVDKTGASIHAEDLQIGVNYVFPYPFASTPCFLLNLGKTVAGGQRLTTENGRHYSWTGGVGAERNIVAFSAICAHRMTYPAHEVSFINYRHEATDFMDSQEQPAVAEQIIFCCSERSVYDATQGARVLGGPASQPLAAILLEHDPETDALFAVGTQGGTLFETFLDKFHQQLALELGTDQVAAPVADRTTVLPLEEYTNNQILC